MTHHHFCLEKHQLHETALWGLVWNMTSIAQKKAAFAGNRYDLDDIARRRRQTSIWKRCSWAMEANFTVLSFFQFQSVTCIGWLKDGKIYLSAMSINVLVSKMWIISFGAWSACSFLNQCSHMTKGGVKLLNFPRSIKNALWNVLRYLIMHVVTRKDGTKNSRFQIIEHAWGNIFQEW